MCNINQHVVILFVVVRCNAAVLRVRMQVLRVVLHACIRTLHILFSRRIITTDTLEIQPMLLADTHAASTSYVTTLTVTVDAIWRPAALRLVQKSHTCDVFLANNSHENPPRGVRCSVSRLGLLVPVYRKTCTQQDERAMTH